MRKFSSFTNWLQGFWMLIGGYFRKKIDADIFEHNFTEKGCQCYCKYKEKDVAQKVWFVVEQPQEGDEFNLASAHRSDDGTVIIYTNIESAPCKVKWITLS